jgi:adenosylcobinamide-GDP ribazoletransferase
MGEPLRLTLVALRFLTRLPLPPVRWGPGDLKRSMPAFPLAGLLVAGIGIGVRAGLEPLLGPLAASVAAVAGMIMATGALHEDGLADTADGIWGGWTPERRLEIMRDSRIGTYGVLALLTVVGLRVALLAPLDLAGFARALVCGHVVGRAAMLALAARLPAAAPGRGAEVVGRPGRAGAAVAAALVTGSLVLATGLWAPLIVVAVAAVVTALCGVVFARRLRGVTGDTLGAAEQLAELAAIATVAALIRSGGL